MQCGDITVGDGTGCKYGETLSCQSLIGKSTHEVVVVIVEGTAFRALSLSALSFVPIWDKDYMTMVSKAAKTKLEPIRLNEKLLRFQEL